MSFSSQVGEMQTMPFICSIVAALTEQLSPTTLANIQGFHCTTFSWYSNPTGHSMAALGLSGFCM
eukprot:1204828-Karenia_brevis.AAC.1